MRTASRCLLLVFLLIDSTTCGMEIGFAQMFRRRRPGDGFRRGSEYLLKLGRLWSTTEINARLTRRPFWYQKPECSGTLSTFKLIVKEC